MINTVENFLKKYDLINKDRVFLVGFSGGYDSLCMLDLLHSLGEKLKFKVVALHLNHNWRGEESKREEENCRKFCEKNSIEFISETLLEDTPKTEAFAREARYEFFTRQAKKIHNSVIFTAHTKADNAETLIYRICKGTGIKGLEGILPCKEIDGCMVYRPLLAHTRAEIEGYCMSRALIANNDTSNFDTNYKRNFIRHKIMPLLKDINYAAENAIVMLSKIARSQNKIVEEYLSIIKKDLIDDERMKTDVFQKLSKDVRLKIIYDFLIEHNLDYDFKKINSILAFINENALSKAGSRCSLTNDFWLFVNSKWIYPIDKIQADVNNEVIEISGEGAWSFSDKTFIVEKFNSKDSFSFPDEAESLAFVDFTNTSKILSLRTRREGDYITPFGMDGTMKLKKYLNSKKISQHKKDGLIMLCDGSEVLWVIGVGLSNKLRVEKIPTHVLRLV